MQIPLNILLLFCIIGLLAIVLVWLIVRTVKSEKTKKDLEMRFVEMENKTNTLQLQTLEARLNPHLFKNILNSIQSHAYQTYFAMDKLSNVLDYILYESQNRFVSPKEEIEFALNLIEINKIKLSPLFSISVKKKIDELDALYEQKILAPLISIDLIENAFKHADLQSTDAFISIIIEFKDGMFTITVTNKVSPKSAFLKDHSGIGAATLEQRLKILYKSCFKLDRYVEEDIYVAQLKINLLEHKNQMLIA
ncbi:histidine kinase [Flavobacterium zepuense]|uniref:Histidine kinase n=1 Tax=Flavobacterium zepuense TaxID=2593302 RepID=A0A552V0E9_9FLAO|nr:histidine kinase [Flavobacterium zepuense]TRW23946.1 histidine kinase [Flavobacterium zepuense]